MSEGGGAEPTTPVNSKFHSLMLQGMEILRQPQNRVWVLFMSPDGEELRLGKTKHGKDKKEVFRFSDICAIQRHERHVKRFFISVRGGGDEEIEVDTPKSRELMVDFLGKLVEKRRSDLQPEAGTDDVVIDIGF